jgi:hypothetical protein
MIPHASREPDFAAAIVGIRALDERGFEVQRARDALADWLGRLRGPISSFAHDPRPEALEYLSRSAHLSSDRAAGVYRFLLAERADSRHYVARLLQSPSAGPELWEAALADYARSAEIRVALAESERAREHPPVRRALERSRNVEVQQVLARSAPPAEFPERFRRYATLLAERGEPFRDAFSDEQVASLSREDLLPLLNSRVEATRLAGLRMLRRLPQRGAEEGRSQAPDAPPPDAPAQDTPPPARSAGRAR